MKNKKKIYILLTAVILVWGFLGYRIFSTVNPTKEKQQVAASSTSFRPQQIENTIDFTINTNYRDPFLGPDSYRDQKKQFIKTKKPIKTIQKIPFPAIIYKGVVSAKGKQQQIFLITIDGQQFFFKKNNTFKDVKLLRGSDKQVVLKFQGQQNFFSIVK